jgi:hypothetical protein
VRWDYENVLKISMLYHARLNVEYTKINIIAFQNEETVLENFATTIDCYWIQCKRDKASTLLGTPATSAVIAHQDQKLADYIDYYQILYPPVLEQMRDSSDNRTKFDFVVACGLAELADEDGMGRPASGSGSASKN